MTMFTFAPAVECVGSEVQADPLANGQVVCPACGSLFPAGGTVRTPRVPIHNTTGTAYDDEFTAGWDRGDTPA